MQKHKGGNATVCLDKLACFTLEQTRKRIRYSSSGGVLLGILGGDVPPGSPDPDPISNQKNIIFHTPFETRPLKSIPVFRPFL